MTSATDMGGNRTCIYLYVGLKEGENICKRKYLSKAKKKKQKKKKRKKMHYVETDLDSSNENKHTRC